ncbi:MAG: ribulose-phosphate 3-epimerase [bacterium]|nr:ribulose-phosphate 3-epimerase [bacterium]MDZ4299748.1 ribulose-phosphate 3-epimerase [Candidatus Sungbacteria bacterium]
MPEIIPSINVRRFEKVQERIAKVEPFARSCHLDVTDGIFSKHETWRNPVDLTQLKTKLFVEVHLMVEDPEKIIDSWLVEPIQRVIVHIEAMKNPEFIIRKCRATGREIGFAIKPETSVDALTPWFSKVDLVQVLGVNPGPSGQRIGQEIFNKIADLRIACPQCRIELDGGVNRETIGQTVKAGADMLVAGSAIFSLPNVEKAIGELRQGLL